MKSGTRLVFDTNILISHLLFPHSVPGAAVKKGLHQGQLLASKATVTELADVLSRPKFDRYITIEERNEFFLRLERIVETVRVTKTIKACKDPDDDKLLELALSGNALYIITGDNVLLNLHPYQNINIITPADFISL